MNASPVEEDLHKAITDLEPNLSFANARAEKAFGNLEADEKQRCTSIQKKHRKRSKITDPDGKRRFWFTDNGTKNSFNCFLNGRQFQVAGKEFMCKDIKKKFYI